MIIASSPAPNDFQTELETDAEADDLALPAAAHQHLVHHFQIDAALHGQRLDRALALLLPDSSRSFLQQLIDSADVQLDGAVVAKAATKLKAGQSLQVHQRPLPQDTAFTPDASVAKSLDVMFEDAHLLIINKAPGLVVHPAAGNWSGTLLNGLLARHECHTLLPRAGIVHRLDKDTSGLMVVARTREAMDALIRMIAAREVHRQYLAIAHYPWRGEPERRVDAPIGRDPRNRQRMAVVDLAQNPGKDAITDFECLANSEFFHSNDDFYSLQNSELFAHIPPDKNTQSISKNRHFEVQKAAKMQNELAADAFCLLRCKLHTGRTHQIRVHSAQIHHPLVADVLYGGKAAGGMNRQALHAEKLAFTHPITHEELSFESNLAPDMAQACQALSLDYNANN